MGQLRADQRGLAVGIVAFIAMIVMAAVLYILLDPAVSALTQASLSTTNNAQAETVIRQRQQFWTYALMACLLAAGIMLVARAVFESGGGVR